LETDEMTIRTQTKSWLMRIPDWLKVLGALSTIGALSFAAGVTSVGLSEIPERVDGLSFTVDTLRTTVRQNTDELRARQAIIQNNATAVDQLSDILAQLQNTDRRIICRLDVIDGREEYQECLRIDLMNSR